MFRRGGASKAADLRAKQIEGLLKLNPNARTVDQVTFDISVPTQYGSLKFRCVLPPLFPEQPPEIRLMVRATHRLVGPDLRVTNHPKLHAWSALSSLGVIVKEIATEFAQVPPAPIVVGRPQPAPAAAGLGAAAAGAAGGRAGGHRPELKREPSKPMKTPVPSVPERFDELDACSTGQLQELLDDSDRFQEFWERMESVKSISSVRDGLYEELEKRAKTTLAVQEQLSELQPKVAELTKIAEEKLERVKALRARQLAVMERHSTGKLRVRMEAEAHKADEESEDLVQKLVDGEMEVGAFVKEYQKLRVLYHTRAAKAERMKEYI